MIDTKMTAEQVGSEIDKSLDLFVQMFISAVKQKTPVDTGKLRNAWDAERRGDEILFFNETEYAQHIEYGTEYIRPVGMLSSTVNEAETIMARAIERTKLK